MSPALQRLFHRVIAARIRKAVALNVNQRGFIENKGVLANCLLLDPFITSNRAALKAYTVVSLDIRKAFYTVSHSSSNRVMIRMGIDENVRAYILSDLSSTKTNIKVGKNT